jgi:hypothetical protein
MAHHSSEQPTSKTMQELLEKLKLGATGEHPQGQLDPTDEGELRIAVGVKDGKVVVHFGKPVAWIGFDARQARALAELIRKRSYEAEGK